jgi:hypothetical protein
MPDLHLVCGCHTAGHRVGALPGAAQRRVKARRPRVGTTRGRSEAKSLDATSTARRIEWAMAGPRDFAFKRDAVTEPASWRFPQ